MTRAVLDTSVLIHASVDPLPGRLAVSVVSFAELQFGVLVALTLEQRAERLRRLIALQRRFDAPLPVDEAVSDSYGQLAAAVTRKGRNPRGRAFDLLIAATAHAHGAALHTGNPGDLVGLEDLVEIVPISTVRPSAT